jgi:hypothetical protein
VSVAVTVGQYRAGAGRLFSVRAVGPGKCKPSPSQPTGNVCRGTDYSQPTKSRLSTMRANQSSRVSELAGIMIAVIVSMLSDMRRGKDDRSN